MNDFPLLTRRTVIGGLAASAVAAATGGLIRPGSAAANAVTDMSEDRLLSGFRAVLRSRLLVLEGDAELAAITQDGAFRSWALARLERIEELRGVTPDPQQGASWRVWVSDRVTAVEAFLPAALRFPFYTHMPLSTPSGEYGPVLRQRIADGVCNGVFLYGNAATPMAPTTAMDSITSSGPPVNILMSPKNVSDPVKLKAWMDYWAARPAWIPYVRVAFWQEPQGDFGAAGQPPVTAWHQGVQTLADAADRVGIANVAHVETWHLHPSQPHGGIPRLLELVQPVIHRLGGGITWSVFVFNQQAGLANDYVQWMNDFMGTYFPYSSYGVSAYGDSLPPSTPPESPERIRRTERIDSMFTDLDASRARYGGYYAVPDPANPEWVCWDEYVSDETAEALRELIAPDRAPAIQERDRVVHGNAERRWAADMGNEGT